MDYVNLIKNNRDLLIYLSEFNECFGEDARFMSRAPGRVNIIGEHVDYHGYCVLPMATDLEIIMAATVVSKGQSLRLVNRNKQYQSFEVDLDDIVINDTCPKWHDYFLCGYQGIVDYVKKNQLVMSKVSLLVLVDGSIPPNSGLSSSSALLVCSAIITMKAFNLNIPKKELAKICSCCEKYIGTQGGGMDQTISLMANEGSAMLIDFSLKDFQVTNVNLPIDAIFVVTNSQEQMNKAASNKFNQRVMESKLSAKVLITLLQPNLDNREFNRLVDVQKKLNLNFTEMLQKIEENIKEVYSKEDLIKLLHVTEDYFNNDILSKNTQEMKEFRLHNRAKHVVSEAERVIEFKKLCFQNAGDVDTIVKMGRLMNESQQSCSEFYECSSDRLNHLVEVCRRGGSLGSRLTGAGWGGCVISLVSNETLDKFLRYVAHNFYHDTPENISQLMFTAKPSGGASFLL